jgi:hypothetical protein
MFFMHEKHDLLNCRNTVSLTVSLFLNLLLIFFVFLPLFTLPLDVALLMAVMAHKISILAL